MKILSIQEAYTRKFKRQKQIKELQYHASGHCAHIGKISPGCYACFVPNRYRYNILSGVKCNLNCVYCNGDTYNINKEAVEPTKKQTRNETIQLLRFSMYTDYNPLAVSFSGGGEPLLYMNRITNYMKFFHAIEKQTQKKPWYYLYTNGTLADMDTIRKLKDLGFDEIRFHLGASNFSKKVYKNMGNAVRHFKAISVETPAWPFHRKSLFEMLPIIEDIRVKHLNITEPEITQYNYKNISKILPAAEIYQVADINLFDDSLVYDIIEEVLRKKYSYSVLDCNNFVKAIQRTTGKWICHEDVKGLCAQY